MAKHAEELMSPEDFAAGAEVHKVRIGYFLTHRLSQDGHPLMAILRLLRQYHQTAKPMLTTRHRLLGDIIDQCDLYVGTKSPKKQLSRKATTVVRLANQARSRLLTEQTRSSELEQKLNAPGQGAKIGGHGGGLRFERVAKAGGLAISGARFEDAARRGQLGPIELTGDDVNDYYALKKLLKTLNSDMVRGAGLEVLEYADETKRMEYEVEIEDDEFRWALSGDPIHTLTNLKGDPPKTCMYACDLNGRFYARNFEADDTNRASFCHSSFLAGDNVLSAGTMKIGNGRLLEITNLSGHYTPGLKHLVDACEAILVGRLSPHGYNPGSDGYVVFGDMGRVPEFKVTSHQQTQFYRFPLKLFAQKKTHITDYLAYECCTHLEAKRNNGLFAYTDPEAARKRGCRLPVV
jgi:hypothetical protein